MLAFSLVFNLPRIRCRFSSSPLRVQGAAFRPPCAPLESFRRFVGPEHFRGRLLNEFVGKIFPSDRSGLGVVVISSPRPWWSRRLPGGVDASPSGFGCVPSSGLAMAATTRPDSVVPRPSPRLMAMMWTSRALHRLAKGWLCAACRFGGVAALPGGVARLVVRLRLQAEHLWWLVPPRGRQAHRRTSDPWTGTGSLAI